MKDLLGREIPTWEQIDEKSRREHDDVPYRLCDLQTGYGQLYDRYAVLSLRFQITEQRRAELADALQFRLEPPAPDPEDNRDPGF
jgi:hypothetical protein